MPLSVIASTTSAQVNGKLVRGREYSWGVAEGELCPLKHYSPNTRSNSTSTVENETHCDFVKLRNLLIRTNMHDLLVKTNEHFYEKYRSQTLASRGHSDDDPHSLSKKMLTDQMKQDEENLRKRFTEQVKLEENRFRQWEQRVLLFFLFEKKFLRGTPL